MCIITQRHIPQTLIKQHNRRYSVSWGFLGNRLHWVLSKTPVLRDYKFRKFAGNILYLQDMYVGTNELNV